MFKKTTGKASVDRALMALEAARLHFMQMTGSACESLYPVEEGETVRQLTPFQEKHWSKEFKKLYQAGLIQSDGNLSREAEHAIQQSAIEQNMDQLLTIADKRIASSLALPAPEEELPF